MLAQLPTGGGKSKIIEQVASAADSVLVLAHAEWLIDQLHALVGGQAIKASVQHDGSSHVVGMVQTIANRHIPEPKAIIVDEAHHCPSATYREILSRYSHARIYGFTATPQRLDGLGLGDIFDELICGPSYQELIAAGWLKPFELMSVPSDVDLSACRTRAGDYAKEDVKHAIRRSRIFGDVVEHYRQHCRQMGGHASFWPSIEAADHAAERFRSQGIVCHALHSKMPRDQIRYLVSALRSGSVDSLATVDMIGEGLDVPGLASVSQCRPTQSLTIYLQHSGRCNRGGAGTARVMDHVANWQRHGLPDDDREWSLQGRVKRRAKPGMISIWDCPACWRVNRSQVRICEGCGMPKPRELVEIEERAAELEVITRADVGEIHDLCSTPHQYVDFARAHGKRNTWAAMKWAERDKRARDDNPFLAAAGQLRPSRAEFLAAAELCGVHSVQAREAAKMMGLRW